MLLGKARRGRGWSHSGQGHRDRVSANVRVSRVVAAVVWCGCVMRRVQTVAIGGGLTLQGLQYTVLVPLVHRHPFLQLLASDPSRIVLDPLDDLRAPYRVLFLTSCPLVVDPTLRS